MTIRSDLHSDKPSKNGFTAREIFVTPFRFSVDRQSTILRYISAVESAIAQCAFFEHMYSALEEEM